MIFEHYDTGISYQIPDEKCNIDDFRVEGNVLILSTGERVAFSSKQGAEDAWIWLQECFRDGGCSRMFIEEKTTAHGWYR